MPKNSKRDYTHIYSPYVKTKRLAEIDKKPGQRADATEESGTASPISEGDFINSVSPSNSGKHLDRWRVHEIVDGEVYYVPQESFVDKETANQWFSELSKLDTWYHPKLKVYGKEVSQSRSIAAYSSDANLIVKYSGHVVTMHHTYPPLLSEIQRRLEDALGDAFNHVMLNRYKDGSEYIGKHRDTKENKMIVSLSLGAERTFIMTPNKSAFGVKVCKWKLANGSLVVMKGKTQDIWKHEIPKESKVKGERISLTFRQLVSSG